MEFQDGDVVNLGIGIPTLVSDYIPENIRVIFQTENGVVGAGPKPENEDLRFIGAGGRCLKPIPGGALVASDMSFGLIREGTLMPLSLVPWRWIRKAIWPTGGYRARWSPGWVGPWIS